MDALNVYRSTLFYYELPLVKKGCRRGLVLQLIDSQNKISWGEIAPLPGRSQETFHDACTQILRLLNRGKIAEELLPSVAFGLDSALTPFFPVTAPCYALLSGDAKSVLDQAAIAEREGHTLVKLK